MDIKRYEKYIEELEAQQEHLDTWNHLGSGDIEIMYLNQATYCIKGLKEVYKATIRQIEMVRADNQRPENSEKVIKDGKKDNNTK